MLTPFPHQAEILERTWDLPAYALFWEMGVGKSRPIIDTIAHLHDIGKIDAALILAPKAVAPNWVHDELPKHLAVPARTFLWRTDKAANKGYQLELPKVLAHDGLLIVVMSYDGIMTERRSGARPPAGVRRTYKGKEFAKELLTSRRCLMALDESARIKNPNTKRTKRILAAGAHAPYRRILTGTPVTNSPFDVFAQIKFLDPTIWNALGCRTFAAFKACFGEWAEHVRGDNGQRFRTLIDYQNLDDLAAVVDRIGSRLLKDDVLDLPPKLYTKRFFEMAPEQRALYEQIRDEFAVWLTGDAITAPLAITRMMRLQQVTSGYCPTDGGDMVRLDKNPRLDCLMDTLKDVEGKAIIWAKFRDDVELITSTLGRDAVRYDGSTSHVDREDAREAFQNGDARFFVANPAAAGHGLTLTAATTVIYYNTNFKLAERLQSEDRAHRIGQEHPVTYIDIVAEGTIDEHIVRALRDKLDLASIITGDKLKEWI